MFSDRVNDFTNNQKNNFVKNTIVDDGGIQVVTKRIDRNTYCTGSGENFAYSFSFLRNSSIQSSQPAITCPKLTIEALEQGMKYVQS